MNIKRIGSVAAIALASSLVLASCAANENGGGDNNSEAPSNLSGTLVGGGASSQGEAQKAWAAAFQTANVDVTVEYDPSGSGNGRDAFIAGASSFAGSDRAFKDEELAKDNFASCKPGTDIVEIPAYISPIAIIFNLDGIDSLNLDADTIAKIFTGEITTWNDPAIAADNPDVTLPSTAITPVHRLDKSGTTGNFTEYLSEAAPESWTHGSVEEWPIAGGEAASQTSGLVDVVKSSTGMIGYADASRAGKLGTVAVKVGEDFVPYSAEAAAAIVDASPMAEGRSDVDLAIKLDRKSDAANVYPVVLISYLIACSEYADAEAGELVKEFFTYIISDKGQKDAAEASGSAPISSTLFKKAQSAVDVIK